MSTSISAKEAAIMFTEGFRAGLNRAAAICAERAEMAMTTHDDCTNPQDRMLLMRTARSYEKAAHLIRDERPA